MPQPTAATLLRLMWLASPALPVGGFSYSEGLEPAIESGLVTDEASATTWIVDQLHLSFGRSELPLMAAAWTAWHEGDMPRIAALNDWGRLTRESAELRAQAEQMGRSLLDWLRQRCPAGDARIAHLASLRPAPLWPVAYALAAHWADAARDEAALAFGFGWAENLVQAALKAVPLGQSAGQRILGTLAAELPAVVDAALALDDEGRQAYTPGLAIRSAQHEAQYSRLFRS